MPDVVSGGSVGGYFPLQHDGVHRANGIGAGAAGRSGQSFWQRLRSKVPARFAARVGDGHCPFGRRGCGAFRRKNSDVWRVDGRCRGAS